MNSLTVVKYYDPVNVNTVYLAAKAYGVEVVAIEPTENSHEHQVCVRGPVDSVARFKEDLYEGDLEPFESKRDLSDTEYEEWLSAELAKLGQLYIPIYTKDEDND